MNEPEMITRVVAGRVREYWMFEFAGVPALVGYGASVAGLDLGGQDLSGLDLSFMNFDGASMLCTKVRGANIAYATFKGTNCSFIDARGADLRGVVTDEETVWMLADLRGARYDKKSPAGIEGAFVCDELSREYLATLGIEDVNVASRTDTRFASVPTPTPDLFLPTGEFAWKIGHRPAAPPPATGMFGETLPPVGVGPAAASPTLRQTDCALVESAEGREMLDVAPILGTEFAVESVPTREF